MMVNVRTSLEAEAMPDQFPYEPRRHEEHGGPNFLRVLRGSMVCLGGIHLIDIRCSPDLPSFGISIAPSRSRGIRLDSNSYCFFCPRSGVFAGGARANTDRTERPRHHL